MLGVGVLVTTIKTSTVTTDGRTPDQEATARTGTSARTGTTARRGTGRMPDQAERTYVLDTSVLLSDPRALFRFAEHSVVIPVVVIGELEGKRHDPEIGYFARQGSACSTICASSTSGSTSRCPRVRRAAHCVWS